MHLQLRDASYEHSRCAPPVRRVTTHIGGRLCEKPCQGEQTNFIRRLQEHSFLQLKLRMLHTLASAVCSEQSAQPTACGSRFRCVFARVPQAGCCDQACTTDSWARGTLQNQANASTYNLPTWSRAHCSQLGTQRCRPSGVAVLVESDTPKITRLACKGTVRDKRLDGNSSVSRQLLCVGGASLSAHFSVHVFQLKSSWHNSGADKISSK